MIGLKLQGGPRLAKALRDLSFEKERAVVRKMLREAAEPIREEAEKLVPVSDEAPHIVDHIVVSATNQIDDDSLGSRRAEDNEHAVAVGPSKDFFYGFFVEYGFGKGDRTPKPFLRPAFDGKWRESLRVFQEQIWAFLRSKAQGSMTGRGQ